MFPSLCFLVGARDQAVPVTKSSPPDGLHCSQWRQALSSLRIFFLNQLSGPTMRNVTKMHVRRASTCLCEVWLLILSLPANCHLIQGTLLSPCGHPCSCLEKGGVGLRGFHSSGSFGNRPLERMGLLSNVLTSTDFLLLLPFDPSKHQCTRAVIVPRWNGT